LLRSFRENDTGKGRNAFGKGKKEKAIGVREKKLWKKRCNPEWGTMRSPIVNFLRAEIRHERFIKEQRLRGEEKRGD